jgi:hypothetical protein
MQVLAYLWFVGFCVAVVPPADWLPLVKSGQMVWSPLDSIEIPSGIYPMVCLVDFIQSDLSRLGMATLE